MIKCKNLLLLICLVFSTILSCQKQETEIVKDSIYSSEEYSLINKVYVTDRVATLLDYIKKILSPVLSAEENEKLNSLKYVIEEEIRGNAMAFEYDENQNLFKVNLPKLNKTLKAKPEKVRDAYIDYLMISRFFDTCFHSPYNYYESLHKFLVPELERINKLGDKEIYNFKLFNDFRIYYESFLLGLILGKAENTELHSEPENIRLLLKSIKHLDNDDTFYLLDLFEDDFKDSESKSDNPYASVYFPLPVGASDTEKNNLIYLGINFSKLLSTQNIEDADIYQKVSLSFQKFLYYNSDDLKKDFEDCISNFSKINPLSYNLDALDKSKIDKISLENFEKNKLEEDEVLKFTKDRIKKNYKICYNNAEILRKERILSIAYEKGLKYKNKLKMALMGDYPKEIILKKNIMALHYLDTAYVQKMGTFDEAFLNLWNKEPSDQHPEFNVKGSDKKALSIRYNKDEIEGDSEGGLFLNGGENRNVYFFRIDVSEGKIIGEHVFNKSNPKAPALSTVLYYAYRKANKAAKNIVLPLTTVESSNVQNEESKMIMDLILEHYKSQIKDMDEYKFDFDADSKEGIALLSTPNIKSCYWLAHDFMDEMGRRGPKKVSIVRSKKLKKQGKYAFTTDLVVEFGK